mmetsp:Transcript_155/g.649  ORF Transcript_155/g.649 Transcript_155/m.649 type:complete len:229 (-) Transcript_155:144-830(-)
MCCARVRARSAFYDATYTNTQLARIRAVPPLWDFTTQTIFEHAVKRVNGCLFAVNARPRTRVPRKCHATSEFIFKVHRIIIGKQSVDVGPFQRTDIRDGVRLSGVAHAPERLFPRLHGFTLAAIRIIEKRRAALQNPSFHIFFIDSPVWLRLSPTFSLLAHFSAHILRARRRRHRSAAHRHRLCPLHVRAELIVFIRFRARALYDISKHFDRDRRACHSAAFFFTTAE